MSKDYTGQLWGWRNNYNGQLGINSNADKCTPVSILGNKKTFCQISSGQNHSIGIDYNGQIWSWGIIAMGSWVLIQLNQNGHLFKFTVIKRLFVKFQLEFLMYF